MELSEFLGKLNSITLMKTSLIISLLTEFSLLFLSTIFKGNIRYIGYVFFIISIILTLFCDKDLIFVSFKSQKKINLLKNIDIFILIFIIIYFPISFYNNYINFKNSYTYYLFMISVIITTIFHFLLVLLLNNFSNKRIKENDQSNEELIEEEIKRAMIEQ